MAEEGTTTTETGGDTGGQSGAESGSQTITTETKGTEGQSGGEKGTTVKGTQEETTFFDPKDLDPSLVPAYKNMQKAFTQRMQEAAKHKHKVEAYDSFERDPVGTMQAMAQRMGFQLTRAEAAQQLRDQQQGQNQQPWEPKSWDEVLNRAKDMAKRELFQEMGPMVNEVKNLRKSALEAFLDSNAPDWREHEDSMMQNLKAHPTLVNDPIKLYRLSVPPEVLEGRATQKALKKMEEKVKGAQIGGGSSTTRKAPLGLPDKSLSFDEAVKFAKAKLAEDGIREPGR
jgi:hypothetical protein